MSIQGKHTELNHTRQQLQFNYVVVGDMGVGKSSLINRFVDNYFSAHQPATTGLDLGITYTKIGKDMIKLRIYSTLGHRSITSVFKLCSKSATGIILVYDITSRKSFESLPYWIESTVRKNEVMVTLVGNRTDFNDKRQVSTAEGKEFANKHGFFFVETSALSGENVPQVFLENVREVVVSRKVESMLKQQKRALEGVPESPKEQKQTVKKESNGSKGIWSKVLLYFP